MEDKIIELLRKNRIGEEKAIYLAHELLFLFNFVGQNEQLGDKGIYCNDCGDYVGEGCDNKYCSDFYKSFKERGNDMTQVDTLKGIGYVQFKNAKDKGSLFTK